MFAINDKTEADQEAKEAFETIFKRLNRCGSDEVELALHEVLGSEHRTLQQNFMRSVVFGALHKFAEMDKDGWHDLRNEASCKTATRVLEAESDGFGYV